MATSTPAAWANLDSCHEMVAGAALRARLGLGGASRPSATQPSASQPSASDLSTSDLSASDLSASETTVSDPGSGQKGTVVVLRPAGAHARPNLETGTGTGEHRPGRLSHGRHRRDPRVAASA
jgi:hypothetical protein